MILPRKPGRPCLSPDGPRQRVAITLDPATAAAVCADKQGARAALDRWAVQQRIPNAIAEVFKIASSRPKPKAAKAKKGAK